MKSRYLNLIYVAVLVAVIILGVIIFYDQIYFFVTGRSAQRDAISTEKVDPRPDLPRITTEELKAKLDNKEKFLLIDVRQPEEFAQGHIKSSVNIPSTDIDLNIGKLTLVKDYPIITVCDASGCNRAEQVAVKLIGLGFNDIRAYSSGVNAWVEAGNELVKGGADRENFVQVLADIKTQEITAADAKNAIANGAVLLDVQKTPANEYIAGAQTLALESTYDKTQDGSIAKTQTVIIYSEDGVRSRIATAEFIKQGYAKTYSIIGGLPAWKNAGYSTTTR